MYGKWGRVIKMVLVFLNILLLFWLQVVGLMMNERSFRLYLPYSLVEAFFVCVAPFISYPPLNSTRSGLFGGVGLLCFSGEPSLYRGLAFSRNIFLKIFGACSLVSA